MDKNTLRKTYKAKREALIPSQLEDNSIAIANKALELPIWEATCYHIFLSISNKKEVQTEFLLHILQGRDKSILVPKADFESGEMKHFLLQENTVLKPSGYGIPEPVAGIELPASQVEVVFIPLLAFDRNGNRIGYGKGFYDRFLAQCREDCLKIGLSFFEAETSIPHDPNDVPLDYCITPKTVYTFH